MFRLANGDERRAWTQDGRIAVDFPLMPASRTELADRLGEALGAKPLETWVAPFGHVAILSSRDTVAGLHPDLDRIAALDRSAVIVTAPGGSLSDVVIRVFAPKVGLPEDPVCGTAHRIIIPYWAGKMGKTRLHSRQLSARGGDLWCEVDGDRVIIAGESELIVEGTMKLSEA
jgi:predicted PhzF superfamily epimerase YddE/YHI9